MLTNLNFKRLIKGCLISPILFGAFILSLTCINVIDTNSFSNAQFRIFFIIAQLYIFYYLSQFLAKKIELIFFKKETLYQQFLIDLAENAIEFKTLESIETHLRHTLPSFLPVSECTISKDKISNLEKNVSVFTQSLTLKDNTISLKFHLSKPPISKKVEQQFTRIINMLKAPIQNIVLLNSLQENINQLRKYQNEIIENEQKKSTLLLNKGSLNRLAQWLSQTLETAIKDIQDQLKILENDLSLTTNNDFITTLENRCETLGMLTKEFIQNEETFLGHPL